jgi:hypothetical protein
MVDLCTHDPCDPARVALPAFDHKHLIAHVDGQCRVISTDLEDPVSNALDGRRGR